MYYNGHHDHYAGMVDHHVSSFGLIEGKPPYSPIAQVALFREWNQAKRKLNARERQIGRGAPVPPLNQFLTENPEILVHFPDAATAPQYISPLDTPAAIQGANVAPSPLPLILGVASFAVLGLIIYKKRKKSKKGKR